jgi:hypothetical protein
VKRWSISGLRPRIWPHLLRLVTNGNVGQAPKPRGFPDTRAEPVAAIMELCLSV